MTVNIKLMIYQLKLLYSIKKHANIESTVTAQFVVLTENGLLLHALLTI